IGGGDSAMEEALFLTRFASKVTLVHRRDEFRASKIMAERVLANPKIEEAWYSKVGEILGDDQVTGLRHKSTADGSERVLDVTGVFVRIGDDRRSDLVVDEITTNSNGNVKIEQPSIRINLSGVFAAGDLVDHTYRQAITAAGTGCAAAQDEQHFLSSLTVADRNADLEMAVAE